MSAFRCGEAYQIDDSKIRFAGNEGRGESTGLKKQVKAHESSFWWSLLPV